MKTAELSDDWDIMLDASGDIALIEGKAQIAQDVASCVRVFRGEDIWDMRRGIPYKDDILGRPPVQPVMAAYMEEEAARVNGVEGAVLLMNTENRLTSISLIVTTEAGEAINVF